MSLIANQIEPTGENHSPISPYLCTIQNENQFINIKLKNYSK